MRGNGNYNKQAVQNKFVETKTINDMKNLLKITTLLVILFCYAVSRAQNVSNSLTVLNIDTKDAGYDPVQMGNIVRLEVDKLKIFQVTDRYDVIYLVTKNKLNIDDCYGKICLVEIGNEIKTDKILTGSFEHIGELLIVSLRLIDIKSKTIEKSFIKEYLYLPSEIQLIARVSIRELFNLENDSSLVSKLSKKEIFESTISNPYKKRLKLDGPRMGYTYFTGQLADYIKGPKNDGGFESIPAMFQFGYQFETQYLNEGNFQALFEFIPIVTGFDQGLFIPSIAVLNGLRNNKNGWEFAFGPTFSFIQEAEGAYINGQWVIKDANNTLPGRNTEKRVDSRGELNFRPGFVVACGKSFRSGRLNIPVNAFIVPSRDGMRYGLSFGFNSKNK